MDSVKEEKKRKYSIDQEKKSSFKKKMKKNAFEHDIDHFIIFLFYKFPPQDIVKLPSVRMNSSSSA